MGPDKVSNQKPSEAYPDELEFIVSFLAIIVDRNELLDYWSRWGYYESSLTFEYKIDYFKDVVRNEHPPLTKEQIKAILRTHAMWLKFDRIVDEEKLPQDWTQRHLRLINHSYWTKIEKQAQLALSLVKK